MPTSINECGKWFPFWVLIDSSSKKHIVFFNIFVAKVSHCDGSDNQKKSLPTLVGITVLATRFDQFIEGAKLHIFQKQDFQIQCYSNIQTKTIEKIFHPYNISNIFKKIYNKVFIYTTTVKYFKNTPKNN